MHQRDASPDGVLKHHLAEMREVLGEKLALSAQRDILASPVGEGKQLLRKRWNDLRTPPADLTRSALARWKRNRGYALEQLLVDLARMEELDAGYGYHRTGEQIDGYFVVNDRHFLLEAKWQEVPIAASDVFAFQGKLRGKLLGTLGLFVSIGRFADDAPLASCTGRRSTSSWPIATISSSHFIRHAASRRWFA